VASNNDQIINALRNLSAPKVQSNSRYTPSQLSQYRSQASVRSASIDALRNAPEYSDQIMRAAAGKSEASGALGNIGKALLDNPISKVVLGGLTILDTGKRAAVSTVREATDFFDTDTETNASVKDWFSQTKDVTYGFGKAFPMEGWSGRLVGLAGDILLDPITYIPGGAFFQTGRKVATGAKLATAEGKVLAEFIGGTKSFASREGRTALAGLVSRMGGSAELVQKVGSEGKRALRLSQEGLDMAGKIGMQRSGIYTYGGKARIPFTGPIAEAIETGLVKSRLTVSRTTPGQWVLNNFTPKGTSVQRDLRKLRVGLATGTSASPMMAKFAAEISTLDNAARAVTNIAADSYAKIVAPVINDADIQRVKSTVFEFLDTPQTRVDDAGNTVRNWSRDMTPEETIAYNKLKPLFQKMHSNVEGQLKFVDPNFTLGNIQDYFPHMMTDDARRWLAKNTVSERGEQVLKYIKISVANPADSFKSRTLKKGKIFFGHEITDKDVLGGVRRLNEIANADGFVGKFFETDIDKVLSKYGSHYAEQFGTAKFMMDSVESGLLQRAKQVAVLDPEWVKGVKEYLTEAQQAVTSSNLAVRTAASQLVKALNEHMAAVKSSKGIVGADLAEAKAAGVGIKSVAETKKALDVAQANLAKIRSDRADTFYKFLDTSEEKTLVMQNLDEMMRGADNAIEELSLEISSIDEQLAVLNYQVSPDARFTYEGKELTVPEIEAVLQGKVRKAANTLTRMEESFAKTLKAGDTFNDILSAKVKSFAATGSDEFDDVYNMVMYKGVRDAGRPGSQWNRGKGSFKAEDIIKVWESPNLPAPLKKLKLAIDPDNTITASILRDIHLEDYNKVRTVVSGRYKEVVKDELGNTVMDAKTGLPKTKLVGGVKEKKSVTIRGIRSRIATGTTTGDNLKELREAGVWLIARDLMSHPEMMKAIVNGTDISQFTGDAAAMFGRYQNLTNMLEQADRAERISFARSKYAKRGVRAGDSVQTQLTPGEIKSAKKMAKSVEYANLVEQIDTLKTQRDDLFNRFNDIADEDVTDKMNKEFISQTNKLNKQINDLTLSASNAAKSMPKIDRQVSERVTQLNGSKELVSDLGAAVSEYYLHRETVMAFDTIMDTLDTVGYKPTQWMYNKLLSQVAGGELEAQVAFSKRFSEAQTFMEGLRRNVKDRYVPELSIEQKQQIRQTITDQEHSYPEMVKTVVPRKKLGFEPTGKQINYVEGTRKYTPESTLSKPTGKTIVEPAGQWGPGKAELFARQTMKTDNISGSNALMEQLTTIFRADPKIRTKANKELLRQKELLSEFFPEFEAVWNREVGNLSDSNRMFWKNPRSYQLDADVRRELEASGITQQYGAMSQRTPRIARMTGTDEVIDKTKFGTISSSTDYQESMYGQLGSDVKKMISSYESLVTKTAAGEKKEEMKALLKNFKDEYSSIIEDNKKIRSVAVESTSKAFGLNTKDYKVGAATLRSAMDSGETVGFSRLLRNAMNGGETAIDDFFSELLGGARLLRGTDYTPESIVDGKLKKIARGRKEYVEIPEHKSYFGTIQSRTSSRISGLNYLANNPDIPTELIKQGVSGSYVDNKWIPGSWALREDLYGVSGYANALENHANKLFEFLNVGEEYKSQIKILEREKLNLGKSISRNQARLNSPKELALQARRNAIEDEISKYKQSEFYSRALRHEKEQMLSMELARFDEDFAVRVLGFDSAEWESLWRKDLSQSNLYKLRTRKGSLVSQRNKLAKTEESFRRGYPGYLETGPSPRTSKLQELDNAISAVDEDIRIFTSRDSAMNKFGKLYDELSDNGTRDAVSNLRSRAKNKDFQYFRSSDNVNIYTDATNISSRREQLVGAYNLSEESRLMQEVRFLQGEFDASMQNSFLSNTEEVAVRYDELVAQIEQVRGKLNQNTLEIQDVESTLYKEISKVATPSKKSPQALVDQARGISAETKVAPKKFAAVSEQNKISVRRQLAAEGVENPTEQQIAARLDEMLAGGVPGTPLEYVAKTGKVAQKQKDIVGQRAVVESLEQDLKTFNIEKLAMVKDRNLLVKEINKLGPQAKSLLKKRAGLAQRLEKEMANSIAGTAGKKFYSSAQAEELGLGKVTKAKEAYDASIDYAAFGPQRIQDAQNTVDELADMVSSGVAIKKTIVKADDSWIASVNDFVAEATDLMAYVNQGDIPNNIKALITNYVESSGIYLKNVGTLSDAKEQKLIANGLKGMVETKGGQKGVLTQGGKMAAAYGAIPPEAIKIQMMFDEGFVALSKTPGFENIGVREELKEIYENVHRITEPQTVRELNKMLGSYTRFFKAYATLSPGFHVRNAMSNTFMLFAAGGSMRNLMQGLEISKQWIKASADGKTVEQWLSTIPAEKAGVVRDAFMAAAASGGGLTDDFMGQMLPFGTKTSKRFGQWIEQHSRFMLAYDGVMKGMDMNLSSARVKRFLIDYQDLSNADQLMRQIVPFWMWTSRNLPMQIQNMWANPKAYALYNNLKDNLSDDQEGDIVPSWMTEIGSFKLPFGKDLYATPDLGFNRIQQQVQELRDPQRLMGNVNPAIRVPLELLGGKQYFSGREFSETPIPVQTGLTTPVASILQPILQGLGFGSTGADGQKFVNDAAYYGIRNLLPPVAVAERLTPSMETYRARGAINPLIGWLGIPVRQVKPQDVENEAYKRRMQIASIERLKKVLEGEE
jgi:hypothetical protein